MKLSQIWDLGVVKQVLSSSWDGRPSGHNRHRPKLGAVPPIFFRGGEGAESHVTQCGLGRGLYLRTKWHLEASSRLATTNMGRKVGAVPFNGMWLGLRPTSLLSGILIHAAIWTQHMGQKFRGRAPLGEGELRPHLTQCGQRHRWKNVPPKIKKTFNNVKMWQK